jgi:site-specific DNA-cytosine methylase
MKKILIGGSPCTYWSIAQKSNREIEAEGLGWELFKNYLIAKEKFQPDYFLYENNKSAAQPIKDQISEELGVPLQYINSSLVSAQNRQRFYAHNIPNVEQPEDRGILLKDILESNTLEKNYNFSVGEMEYMCRKQGRWDYGYIQHADKDKANCITANISKGVPYNTLIEPIRIGTIENESKNLSFDSKQYRVYSPEGKATTICGQGGGVGAKTGLYACPIETFELDDEYYKGAIDGNLVGQIVNKGKYKNGNQPSQQYRVYTSDGKSICVDEDQRKYYICPANGMENIVYHVQNGMITVKGKLYPINLPDGYYIIRKLTPVECERLQTLPDNYTEGVSSTQRYKGLGNGWTAEVIIHILKHMNIPIDEEIIILSMYDGIGTGRYCFDKLGYKNVKYYSYEIDKYAMQVAQKNYPNIIQCGDAFDVRKDDWKLK